MAINKLHSLQLLYSLFSLNIQFCSTSELKYHLNPITKKVYIDLLNSGLITELNYTSYETYEVCELCKLFSNLSSLESTGLYLAKREEAALFATHQLVRDAAAKLGIAVYGYNWVFDQFSLNHVFPPMEVFQKWKDLEAMFYSSTDSTLPEAVKLYYMGKALRAGR